MRKILINYADKKFFQSQLENCESATSIAGFDETIPYGVDMINEDFINDNNEIMSSERGAGYWLWKPYIINEQFNLHNEGDIVMYSDSGAVFARHMQPLFNTIAEESSGIIAFSLAGGHFERQYNRKRVIESFDLDTETISRTPQLMASFIMFRICEESRKIVEYWLNKCVQPDLIMDKSTRDPDEFPEFIDHRHDQALWSLTAKKFGLSVYRDPTQWGLHHGESEARDFFINHHRSKA